MGVCFCLISPWLVVIRDASCCVFPLYAGATLTCSSHGGVVDLRAGFGGVGPLLSGLSVLIDRGAHGRARGGAALTATERSAGGQGGVRRGMHAVERMQSVAEQTIVGFHFSR